MASRAGLSNTQSSERLGVLDLPHSPHSGETSPIPIREGSSQEETAVEGQMKGSLLSWLKSSMRKEFQDLVKEHQLLQSRPKGKGKQPREKPSRSPTPDPKRSKDDLTPRPKRDEYPFGF